MIELNGKNQVVNLLRRKPLSRVDLAKQTGLVKSSLTKITQQLLNDGIIEEMTSSEQTQECTKGRPKTALRLVPHKNFSLCCYISIESFVAILIDQTNKILCHQVVRWDLPKEKRIFSAAQIVEMIQHHGHELCRIEGIAFSELKVITVATQGKIAQHSGLIHCSQILKERHFNLAEYIEQQTGHTAKIFNIAHCSCAQLRVSYSQLNSFVTLLLGYGAGLGVMIDKKIALGPAGTSPEISHMTYDLNGRDCYCGAKGCCETYITYRAIIAEIEKRVGHTLPGKDAKEQLHHIVSCLEQQQPDYIEVVNEAAKVMGFIISHFITVWDIHDVILSGEVSILFDYLKPQIEHYLQHNSDLNFGSTNISFWHERDYNIAYYGLIELTNRAYQV
ncbi:ROK family protein [Vibrio tritonius]|uniref:ROK family protein n=1 Tax=Vibrio tritonius TaxID=1435069 RepID=A0ABS7YTJ1_9VIBR|nr:ROK family protein [Vibrio tritonius]MCA2018998.1 ROK family protein [Vibrio tritonius]